MEVYEPNRIDWIDSLRGFAILLVIVGHLIQFNYETGIENKIFNIIYSFHMPLFFFISGLCTIYAKQIVSYFEFCKFSYKKFIQLILPSICWTLIVPLFFTQDFPRSFNIHHVSSFWFLNSLFVIYIAWGGYNFLCSKVHIKPIVMWISVICFITLFVLGIKRISLMYLALFVFGYYYQKLNIGLLRNKYLLSVLALIFFIFCGLFDYGSTLSGQANRIWLEFPLSIIASIVLVEVFKSMKKGVLYSKLTYIGKYTLGIYLCHFCFIHDIDCLHYIETMFPAAIQISILMTLAIIIAFCCIGIQKMIETTPILHGLMYGKWNFISKKNTQ